MNGDEMHPKVELTEVEQEKQPMTGAPEAGSDGPASPAGPETNGVVSVKVPDDQDQDVKFTGLNKDELLRVAGTPGWVRARWALLLLFWLGWLGVLTGAVLIILQAPRCRDLPRHSWWSQGPLYQLGPVQAFSADQNLTGVKQHLDRLTRLKVKGLVLGPIHVATGDQPESLRFEEISPDVGTLKEFKELLHAAHKKGISVVLDLTPNYQGTEPWFSSASVTVVAERLKSALVFWFSLGVDGVQLDEVERVATVVPSLWADIRTIVKNGTDDRVLIGVTNRTLAEEVSTLLNFTGVDLLLSGVLRSGDATERAQSIQHLAFAHDQNRLAWNVGSRTTGHLATLVGAASVRLYQLLLLTLPGTPVFNYGDEIGLKDEVNVFPRMLWDSDIPEERINGTLKEEREERLACRAAFRALSDLRQKERSLMFGDLVLLHNSSTALAFLRCWDQSARLVSVLRWAGDGEERLELRHAELPADGREAEVVLDSHAPPGAPPTTRDMADLRLGPRQALLLRFPSVG